jgi:hypothetical protein
MKSWDGPHDDKMDAAAFTAGAARAALTGIRGWLLGYILSLGAAAYIYGRGVIDGIQDPGLHGLPLDIVGTLFILAIAAMSLMATKNRLGIFLSKIFIAGNAILFVLGALMYSALIPVAFIAVLWGGISWLYLTLSKRVRNTYSS